jgi:aldehyde dehydrogenase (NAD+)
MTPGTPKDPLKTITTHYIDGAFMESHGREVMDMINPASGTVIAHVTLADEEDTRGAIAAAKRAFAGFSQTTKQERIALLRNLHDAVSARVDELTNTMIEEYGGARTFANAIVESGASVFLATAKALEALPLSRRVGRTTITLEPVGVTGVITPWNANAFFLCMKLSSALAAGCTVVMKPSELSSLQTQTWLQCVQEAKLPPGVCNVVTGRGEVVGAELVRNPDVAKITFTGSAAVGKSVMRDGAATMKRVTLELGGKSANIILDDADFETAIPNALGIAFLNSGQACIAGTRLLVPKSRFDEVRLAILEAAPAFPAGAPDNPKTAVGPMVSQKQYERVQSYIRKGIEEGADVLVGGEGHPPGLEAGYFVKPTVFVRVKNSFTIAREEIFGPVLSVITYEDDEDAVRIANDSDYGLHAYVSGTDIKRARRVAAQIQAGRVALNGFLDDQQAPFGGFKHSGVGREFGTFGIEAFLEPKALLE